MAEAAREYEPQTIKISSKRQITIPAKWYRDKQFTDYAIIEWTADGILIKPIEVDREDVSVNILRYLVSEGYEGDELVDKYVELREKVVPIEKLEIDRLNAQERPTPKGTPKGEFMKKMFEKYGDEFAREAEALAKTDDEGRELERLILESSADIAEGKVGSVEDMIKEARDRFGL